MKMLRVVMLLVLSLLATSSASAKSEVHHYRFSGNYVYLFWEGDEDCIETSLQLWAGEGRAKEQTGQPEPLRLVSLSFTAYDYCQGEYLASAFGSTSQPDVLRIKSKSAALRTDMEVCDVVIDTCYPVSVDSAWSGESPAYRTRQVFQDSGPGYRTLFRVQGVSRDAQVSGSIELPSRSILLDSDFGVVGSTKASELRVYKQ